MLVRLVALRLLLRNERRAAIGVAVLYVIVIGLGATDPVVQMPLAALRIAIVVFVASRMGVVALAMLLAVNAIGALWIPPFTAGSLVLQFTAMTALGVVGFAMATRGPASTAWLDA
jgi:hypothetical protein